MNLPPFKLEEYWKKYEFNTPHLFCCSDMEPLSLNELLSLADHESKQLWESLKLGYTEPNGHPLLRHEISRLYSNVSEKEIITFAGAEEGIYCTMQALIAKNDHVIVVEPCYQSLQTLPKSLGADVTSLCLKFEEGWELDLRMMENAFRPTTKLVILNFPHNPTGALLPKKVQDGIIELARRYGAFIFCDEVYRFLEIDEADRTESFADAYEKGISLNVMTKSFGLAGLRVGWVASKDADFLQKVGSYKLYTTICNSAPSEILSIIALREKKSILQRNRKLLLENLKLLDAFMMRQQNLFSWVRPKGGTMALLKLLGERPVEEFVEELIKKEGILTIPGSVLDIPGNFMRIGFGRANTPELLNRFEQFCNKLTTFSLK